MDTGVIGGQNETFSPAKRLATFVHSVEPPEACRTLAGGGVFGAVGRCWSGCWVLLVMPLPCGAGEHSAAGSVGCGGVDWLG
ncbi:MAG: hypothetical protein QOJ44_2125 [Acidimicrobiaceae bacterium]|nr:hypothetical protein [Acidimicrobiaceae bacterium]